MSTRALAPGLGLIRAVAGAAALGAPQSFAALSGVPGDQSSPYARYITRHNGVRELLIGAMVIVPPTRATGLRLGVACDLLDVVVGVLASKDGAPESSARALVASAAVMAIGGAFVTRQSSAQSNSTMSIASSPTS